MSDHRSFSQLSTFRQCGEQYRLYRIEHASQRPSSAAVGGTAVHVGTETIDIRLHEADPKILANPINAEWLRQDIVSEALQAALQQFQDDTDKAIQQGWNPETWISYGPGFYQNAEWWRTKAIGAALNAYIDWRLVEPDIVLADVPGFGPGIEVPFDVTLGGIQIQGRIDRVFQSLETGTPFCMDIKSGAKPKSDEQLGLYRTALKAQYGIDVTYGVFVYGLKKGEAILTPPLDLSHWTAEKLFAQYSNADKAIRQGLYVASPGEYCRHCGFTDICKFYQSVV